MQLPEHFYDPVHPKRWQDPFANTDGTEKRVLTPHQMEMRYHRNRAYEKWLRTRMYFMGKPLRGKQIRFQPVQILGNNHALKSEQDWWDRYRDAVFYVFVNPETRYSKFINDHVQWYLLAPEESEMVLRHRAEEKGITTPPRRVLHGERWLSRYQHLRRALLVPVECCRHWRHETTGGQLPEGL